MRPRNHETPVLPDVVSAGLDILFCGTAAGAVSAQRHAYYAGPGNAFWPTLFEVGLIPEPLRPHEFARIIEWRLGVTDLAKFISGSDASLPRRSFDRARVAFLIAQYEPRIVAFTSKRAAVEFLGHEVDFGLLRETAMARFFVLPSPSGAARRYWNLAHWHALAELKNSLPRAAGW